MIQQLLVSLLTLYFALSLGISGLAKIDRPLIQEGSGWLISLGHSHVTTRALATLEIIVAFLLASGAEVGVAVTVNAALAGVFLVYKVALLATHRGSPCGCFGAHELMAVDAPSVVSSTLILGLAVVLAVLARRSAGNPFYVVVSIMFLTAFAGITFRMLKRWDRRQLGSKPSQVST
jgi:hypothetical protein